MLMGCASAPQDEIIAPTETADTVSAVLPTEETVTVNEPIVAQAVVETPAPEPETPVPTEVPTPAPTDTPEPTVTPEANPFLGKWSIDDQPFLLEVCSDGTYIATSDDFEYRGTYTASGSDLHLHTSGEDTIDFKYYYKTDKIVHDRYVLIRSEIASYGRTSNIPTTFTDENEYFTVSVRGAVVDVVVKGEQLAQEYCFTNRGLKPKDDSIDWFNTTDSGEPTDHFRVYKYDRSYTLSVRDAEKNLIGRIDVTVDSGFRYPINAKGMDALRHSLRTALKENNSSVSKLNAAISEDIAAAGLYTREGVVTSGVSLISHMSEYGYSIVYQGGGSYQAARDWGVNPQWGEKLETPTQDASTTYYYCGMQCVASIIWAYKQAGMNLFSTVRWQIEKLGEREKAHDNRIENNRAKSGDIIGTGTGHYMMVIDRIDQNNDGVTDAYLTYEYEDPHLTVLVLPYKNGRGYGYYSMDAVFENVGHNRNTVTYWNDTYRIPKDAFPEYLTDAVTLEESEQAFAAFLKKFE